MTKTASALIFAILLCVGCANVEKRTYEITLKNDSSKYVVAWLTKNGPAYENGWKSPEEYAIEKPGAGDAFPFQTVPPGKTAFTGKIPGQFAPGVKAILRLYMGQHKFDEILAISPGSPDRIEVVLTPGVNELRVIDAGSGIKVEQK